jgi:hypothetical protein
MKARDESSQKALELAAGMLCKADEQRQILQFVYDLGASDGKLAFLEQTIAEFKGRSAG